MPPRRLLACLPKLVGAKAPLRPSHVWSIRTKLQMEGLKRDLALAIDSKLRGCDVVAVRIDDVAPNGYALDRATVRERRYGSSSPTKREGDRRVFDANRPKARPVVVFRPPGRPTRDDHSAVHPARRRPGRQHRPSMPVSRAASLSGVFNYAKGIAAPQTIAREFARSGPRRGPEQFNLKPTLDLTH
jgi:hypothetical protein